MKFLNYVEVRDPELYAELIEEGFKGAEKKNIIGELIRNYDSVVRSGALNNKTSI